MTDAATRAAPIDQRSDPRKWRIMWVLGAVAFMAQLDFFIVNVALDGIGASFPGSGAGALSWVLNSSFVSSVLAGPRTEAHWEYDFRNPADDAAEKVLGLTLHQCALNVVRGPRHKYVHFTKLPPLFFDLERDPGEFVDRARDPDCLPLVLEHAQKLLSWRMNHDEQTLTHIALGDDGPVARPSPRA